VLSKYKLAFMLGSAIGLYAIVTA